MKVEQKKNDATIKAKAEFVISVFWPDELDDDIDTWLKDPQGRIVFYKNKEVGIMHIDRDDRGMLNDTVLANGIRVKVKTNQELTTIRGFIPGEWILNLHYYRRQEPVKPVPVTVTITKLNPKTEIILKKTITLDQYWQEETIARFEMSSNGEILNVDEEFPHSMVHNQIGDGFDSSSQYNSSQYRREEY
jgi:hypothetical protein